MPIATYGITHAVTGNLFTLCTCAQRELTAETSPDFCKALVGDKLSLGFMTVGGQAFTLDSSDLAADELNASHVGQLVEDLFSNLVDGTPGDAQKKNLVTGVSVGSTLSVADGTGGMGNSIDVTVAITASQRTELFVSIEGMPILHQTVQLNNTTSPVFTFDGITYSTGRKYAVLVFGTGYKAEVRYIQT